MHTWRRGSTQPLLRHCGTSAVWGRSCVGDKGFREHAYAGRGGVALALRWRRHRRADECVPSCAGGNGWWRAVRVAAPLPSSGCVLPAQAACLRDACSLSCAREVKPPRSAPARGSIPQRTPATARAAHPPPPVQARPDRGWDDNASGTPAACQKSSHATAQKPRDCLRSTRLTPLHRTSGIEKPI